MDFDEEEMQNMTDEQKRELAEQLGLSLDDLNL